MVWDAYRQREWTGDEPCSVCGDEDADLKNVGDGYKPLCDEHWNMFGP